MAAAALAGISVVGISGTAHAGTTGSVSISVPGCIGHLNLAPNWAYGHLDSYTTTCWLTVFDRNDQTGKVSSQTISYGPGGSGDTGQSTTTASSTRLPWRSPTAARATTRPGTTEAFDPGGVSGR
ncbi:hypothetical protein [Kitasatospora aureofaciens]|uniref:hypothetical protein n=1 Tax=Kitasatospora aureofaciens TaxID=1894 RepID=UPI00131C2D04|nr:hypothetical protein [Kitasatospora aureofaciens]